MKKILFVSDACKPQINGVVRHIEDMLKALQNQGIKTRLITPTSFPYVKLALGYPLFLPLISKSKLKGIILKWRPDHIHIETEGMLGHLTKKIALELKIPFTTYYHTKFPEYLYMWFRIPLNWTYAWLKKFHTKSSKVFVATEALKQDLTKRGFLHVTVIPKGVDTTFFKPLPTKITNHENPVLLYVGRIGKEKNLEAFLNIAMSSKKILVGDGPQVTKLQKKYPEAEFVGEKESLDLLQYYQNADVFVFPSHSETFGNVSLEALACGTPLAAFPSQNHKSILSNTAIDTLDEDLETSIRKALTVSRQDCRELALKYTLQNSARAFIQHTIGDH